VQLLSEQFLSVSHLLFKWRWQDGPVDLQKEYIELGYEDSPDTIPIALIGRPENNLFPVRWLVGTEAPENKRMINLVKRELNFYLVEKEEPDPWEYAKYRCTTASNLYSSVHWSYYPEGDMKGKHYGIINRPPSKNR
jgi:hypothetical protein